MGLNSLLVLIINMRIYFSNGDLSNLTEFFTSIELSNLTDALILSDSYLLTKIYSTEGIFHLFDNILHRVKIIDHPIERTSINNLDFIIDKSTILYEEDWVQLSPNHIIETVNVYTYSLPASPAHTVGEHTSGEHTSGEHTAGAEEVQLFVEKKNDKISEMYFVVEDETNIVTFLSELKLC
jgi:hypothetical protein